MRQSFSVVRSPLSVTENGRRKTVNVFWLATSATGPHPFPSRTRSLSLSAPMVLPLRGGGRVGRRQLLIRSPLPSIGAGFLFLGRGEQALQGAPQSLELDRLGEKLERAERQRPGLGVGTGHRTH